MPEEQKPQAAEGQENRGTLRLRQENAKTSYANVAFVTTTPEEVVLSFGVNVMPPNEQKEVFIDVSDRIIMSYTSAKRLAITLGNLIQRYEAARGVIDLGQQGQAQPPPPAK